MQQTRISSLKSKNKTLENELESARKVARQSNGNNAEECELLLQEKDSQIAEYIKDMDMNQII